MGTAHSEDAATHMDGIYRYQRHIYDLTRKYFLLGRDRLLADLDPPPGGTVLEIGCGTARNLVLAAKRHPNARYFGFDISDEMLVTAKANIDRAGLSDKVTLAQGDATDFDLQAMFGLEAVDRAFCSYTLSMIPPWKDVLPAAVDALAPGGRLHVVDFGPSSGLPKLFKSGLYAWLNKFSVHPRAELEAELRKVADAKGCEIRFEMLYRGYADYAVVTRPASN